MYFLDLGVGRTGTIVALEACMRVLTAGKSLSVFDIVKVELFYSLDASENLQKIYEIYTSVFHIKEFQI